ncbi:MAG: energy transducer TonB [Bacteroidales bacterium]|nr:energy transducer TonB [Bacteroidales bacterium]
MKKKKNKHNWSVLSDFFDYSEGNLREQDRNAFERRMQKDPFESEALEGFSGISREESDEDLFILKEKIHKRINRKRRIVWYSAAAAAASILIVTTLFINISDSGFKKYETIPEFSEEAAEKPVPDYSLEEEIADERSAAIEKQEITGEKETMDEEKRSQIERERAKSKSSDKEESSFAAIAEMEKKIMETKSAAGGSEGMQEKTGAVEAETTSDVTGTTHLMAESEDEFAPEEVQPPAEAFESITVIDDAEEIVSDTEVAFSGNQVAKKGTQKIITFKYDKSDDVTAMTPYGNNETISANAIRRVSLSSLEESKSYPAMPAEGIEAYTAYMDSAIAFPAGYEDTDSAMVELQFYISQEGRPFDVTTIQSPDDLFSEEATRIILEGPDWKPASENGAYKNDPVRMHVCFVRKPNK